MLLAALIAEPPGATDAPGFWELWARWRPAWLEKAACRGEPVSTFFPTAGWNLSAPRRVCAGCPARVDCLEHALGDESLDGVWGGTSPRQRAQARRDGVDAAGLIAHVDRPRVREAAPPSTRPPCTRCGGRLGNRDEGPLCWGCV